VTTTRRKLIEVSLPLEAINRESAREKSIRHGHPSTLHLWWARRPLAACRAVLFAQLVDDPSSHPEEFRTEEAQVAERQRLFDIIERLVVWENSNDDALLEEAHKEILKSTGGHPPSILDPFAGGGSIPLEAQRLGLDAQASDLNPVAVLINKALIEIPPKFVDQSPVFPGAADESISWPKATGLAEDVRQYGQWMRDEAEKRLVALYPKATLPNGVNSKVIAWIWARTITCPNPACGIQMPLVRSWWLGKKKGKEAYVVPIVRPQESGGQVVEYAIGHDLGQAPTKDNDGTVGRRGAKCIACDTAVPLDHVRDEGKAGRIGTQLMAVVAQGNRRREYLAPTQEHEVAGHVERPHDVPETELPEAALSFRVQAYGMTHHAQLFTNRQLTVLATFSDLVAEARARILEDGRSAGIDIPEQYAAAVSVYLAFGLSRVLNKSSNLCSWDSSPKMEAIRGLFSSQAIPMVWDFAEANPLAGAAGDFAEDLDRLAEVIVRLPATARGEVQQSDAATRAYSNVLVATDPPYYDNIGYANLSDFFYGWLRRSLGAIEPELLATVQTPKADELVAEPFRHGSRAKAARFFETGFNSVFARVREYALIDFPITVFYAFKQSETDDAGTASTGWQTLLEGMLASGWTVTATWPVRTELANKVLGNNANMLASSVVLALRPRSDSAETISRRSLMQALQSELPARLRELQQGLIAPVDMAQAAIGPGMAVFSRYARVMEADGSYMTVRMALALINQVLDEVLAEQEGDFDAETRFAVKWFSQYGWNEAPSGEADVLTRAVNTTVSALERGGIFRAAAGKARLVAPAEMTDSWSPSDDKAISVWEVSVRLGHALLTEGQDQAASWMRDAASRVDLDAVKELAYLMYSVCERKGWTESAMLFNALGTSWGDIVGAARETPTAVSQQGALSFDDVD